MQEKLLQYIWQFQLYNAAHLTSTNGDAIFINHPGQLNCNQGPDFLNADITIASTRWAGHIETHVYSSDWKKHGHESDSNYKNVILHVVWSHDVELELPFPTLELNSLVPKMLLQKYDKLMSDGNTIPCNHHFNAVNLIVKEKCKERMLIERLHQKAIEMFSVHTVFNHDWEEYCWRAIATQFGGKVNAASFNRIATSLPYKIILQNRFEHLKIEALLFGQSGLLNRDFTDDYPIQLKREYNFLQSKYNLKTIPISLQFLRMRPAGFPTLRLSQLARLLVNTSKLCSTIISTTSIKELKAQFKVEASAYWKNHYVFDTPSGFAEKQLGETAISGIIINVAAVLVYAYGFVKEDDLLKEKAVSWLMELEPEQNKIVSMFNNYTFNLQSAYDTQAAIQLYSAYCRPKRCIDCMIGHSILSH